VGARLNSAAGFALDGSLRLASETNNTIDRSGFSNIVLDRNNNGVELSFWTDEDWAKIVDAAFSHAESVEIDTISAARSGRPNKSKAAA
jgi:hypothetical protein